MNILSCANETGFRNSGNYVLMAKKNKYTRPSLFTGPYLTVSQIRAVAPRTKKYPSNPSMLRGIKIVRHLEQVFDPYRMTVKELKGKTKRFPPLCFCKNTKTLL